MSMKNFPNSERFWQYNWILFSWNVRYQDDGGYLILRPVNFPYCMCTSLVNFLSWGVPATTLFLCVTATTPQFNLEKV